MTEQFYRNLTAPAHPAERAASCLQPRTDDLPSWVIEQLQARPGESILTIGNRDGRLTLALTRNVGAAGYVLAIDHSYRVLNALSQQSQEQDLQGRLRFLYLNLDDLDGHLRPDDFDRALCSGALARSRQPQVALYALFQALKPGGTLFFCGPARKDLGELGIFCVPFSRETPAPWEKELCFMERIGLPYVRDLFTGVEILMFERTLRLNAPEALLACWRESAFYEEVRVPEAVAAAQRYFQSHTLFETTRYIVGIRARK
ncbi:MAG TPA: methyltransferase [Ktedonobacteraceae bacterium]|jgi:ubiquinone/menaquinone biosynthesis C-methylase UbiE